MSGLVDKMMIRISPLYATKTMYTHTLSEKMTYVEIHRGTEVTFSFEGSIKNRGIEIIADIDQDARNLL